MGGGARSARPNPFRRLGSGSGLQYFDVVPSGDRRGLWAARFSRYSLFVGSLPLDSGTGVDKRSRLVCFFLCFGDE